MLERCFILREDPDLASAIEPGRRAWALDFCVAPAVTIQRGPWEAARLQVTADGIGLLVLDGLLLRRVGVEGRFGAELLGTGDILRPEQGDDAVGSLQPTTGWRVLSRTRVAVLDARVAERLARFPSLTGAITARVLARARFLALIMAILHHPRIDVRLHMLLWHLADRWGRVRVDGVFLPLPLSHSVLADLVAAQRPSVTGAIGKLAERGLVTPVKGGWLLSGDPPGELLRAQRVEVGAKP